MNKERKYLSVTEVEKEIKKLDLDLLLKELEAFALYQLYNNDNDMAFDIVGQAFDKLLNQERKWYEGDTIIKTLFGTVRSLSSNQNKKIIRERKTVKEGIEIENLAWTDNGDPFSELNFKELRSLALNALKDQDPPPDYLEELIFECWIEGMTKQQEIASYLEKDIVEIRNGVKRLNRKLGPIKDTFKKMGYEKK